MFPQPCEFLLPLLAAGLIAEQHVRISSLAERLLVMVIVFEQLAKKRTASEQEIFARAKIMVAEFPAPVEVMVPK